MTKDVSRLVTKTISCEGDPVVVQEMLEQVVKMTGELNKDYEPGTVKWLLEHSPVTMEELDRAESVLDEQFTQLFKGTGSKRECQIAINQLYRAWCKAMQLYGKHKQEK